MVFIAFVSCSQNRTDYRSPGEKPNIVLILADDLGAGDLNIYGSKDLITPHLDKLAMQGVRFSQFYVNSSVCGPTRAALLTGKYPQNVGFSGLSLSTDHVTMAGVFKDAGYKTAIIGKWHLGESLELGPNKQGFDEFFGFRQGVIDVYSHFYHWGNPIHPRHDLWRNEEHEYHYGENFNDLAVKESGRFIEENKNQPFFLFGTCISQLDALGYYILEENYLSPFLITNEFPTGETEVIFAFNHEDNHSVDISNGYTGLTTWGFLAPTQSMINAYEENDPRFGWTYNLETRKQYKLLGTTSGGSKSATNHIYIRYGDVLLWKAECLIMNGQVAEGVTLINQIRERARNSGTITGEPVPEGALPDRPTNITQDQAMDFLVHERRIELACEMHRFRDLRRWGLASCQAVLGSSFTEKNLLYPIPQSEIDKSGAYLIQNPGY